MKKLYCTFNAAITFFLNRHLTYFYSAIDRLSRDSKCLMRLIKINLILLSDVDVFFRQGIIRHDSQSNGVNGNGFRFALFRFAISVGRYDWAWSSQTCLLDEFTRRKLSFNEILPSRFPSWKSPYPVEFPSISVNSLKINQYNIYIQIYLMHFACQKIVARSFIIGTNTRARTYTNFALHRRVLCGALYNLLIKGRDYRFCRRVR